MIFGPRYERNSTPKSFIYINNSFSMDCKESQTRKILKVKQALHVNGTFVRQFLSLSLSFYGVFRKKPCSQLLVFPWQRFRSDRFRICTGHWPKSAFPCAAVHNYMMRKLSIATCIWCVCMHVKPKTFSSSKHQRNPSLIKRMFHVLYK